MRAQLSSLLFYGYWPCYEGWFFVRMVMQVNQPAFAVSAREANLIGRSHLESDKYTCSLNKLEKATNTNRLLLFSFKVKLGNRLKGESEIKGPS